MSEAIGSYLSLVQLTFTRALQRPFRIHDFIRQLVFVAWESMPVIIFSVSFAAAVAVIEASFHMRLVIQDDSLVPGFTAMLILRELGVVITALLLTSRIGAGLAAEVGTMQITEQVDALRMLAIDPIKYLVVPRFWGSLIGCVIVTTIASLVCLYFAMLVSLLKLNYSSGAFLVAMRTFVDAKDLVFAMIKGAVFGAIIPVNSCFYGFRCRAGAEGVGLATTNSVVTTSVMIIIMDFVLTWTFSHFY